jgi:hypothetical protein
MMWTSWSHDQATHTQRHQIPRKPSKSGFIRVWHKDNLYLGTNTIWCEPRDHVVTQPTIRKLSIKTSYPLSIWCESRDQVIH